jgi:predicted nucleic acid-binding protein
MKEFEQTYFIDTNIFLRIFVKENTKSYDDCFELFNKIKNSKAPYIFYTGNIVTSEVLWTLTSYYKETKVNIIEKLNSISHNKNLDIVDNYDLNTALVIFENFNVKFADALIASIPQIREKKWTVISYDKDFDKIGVIRKEPGQVAKLLS